MVDGGRLSHVAARVGHVGGRLRQARLQALRIHWYVARGDREPTRVRPPCGRSLSIPVI